LAVLDADLFDELGEYACFTLYMHHYPFLMFAPLAITHHRQINHAPGSDSIVHQLSAIRDCLLALQAP
jgi:hypothetical protein